MSKIRKQRLEREVKKLMKSGLSYIMCEKHHYKIDSAIGLINYWPSTMKYRLNGVTYTGGVRKLVRMIDSFN